MRLLDKYVSLPEPGDALPGRAQPMPVRERHVVSGRAIDAIPPAGAQEVVLGMGCFWGAERRFWQLPGVYVTAVGYAGGLTPNPEYEEVCSGMTGHTEVVRVVYMPAELPFTTLLQTFWESHNPTQGMRQGNDVGTQYRSAIYCYDEKQLLAAARSRDIYQQALTARGFGEITTEIRSAPTFYYAETYHQQYLARNPAGYCGLGGTGVSCPG
ncbi:MAG: peptide-methionine (S)-S-oxide reductase MsrA [Gammaproteobacteria bacterium]|nr:peptide-methionine (S)-S-oxide reductase MsrA [Gammaproteobacteria bacterium]